MPSLRDNIYLIGYPQEHLVGSKLPSNGDCLKVLFYKLRFNKYSINKSIREVINECSVFWKKANIPVQYTDKSIKKLKKLYDEWKTLLKNKNRNSDTEKKRREEWKASQNNLFDIAHRDALTLIRIEQDKQFLLMQRSKERKGCMSGLDVVFKRREENRKKRQLQEETYKNKTLVQANPSTSQDTMTNIFSDNESAGELFADMEVSDSEASQKQTSNIRAKSNILTPRLVAVLDKLKVSSRDAVHLLVAVLDAVGLDSSEYIINRSSIRKQREDIRKKKSKNLMEQFSNNAQCLAVHWDTKLFAGIKIKEERLAIIATGAEINQIISMPEIPSGTGLDISSAVYEALEINNVLDKVEAFVFDTTSSNTGKFKGACNILEKKIGRDILFLGCRHHIFEIVLAAVFNECNVEKTTGPEIVLYKNFKKHWPKIDQQKFLTVAAYPRLKKILGDQHTDILAFANEKLLNDYPRNDYRELLELIVVILNGIPPRGIKFVKPGALHLARWMAKGIYCLKILIFKSQFPEISETQTAGLIEFAGFIIKCYLFHWFDADCTEQAPLNDIEFLRKINNYKTVNMKVAEKAICKFQNHLYYLNEECVGFSLFDERIPNDVRAKLVLKMNITPGDEENHEDEESLSKKLVISQQNMTDFLSGSNTEVLEKLFTRNTKNLLKRFRIPTDFLETAPSSWADNIDYQRGKYSIQGVKVVNDPAERGIKLIQDYHEKITKDEEQRQYIFKVIQHYTQQYSKDVSLASMRKDFI